MQGGTGLGYGGPHSPPDCVHKGPHSTPHHSRPYGTTIMLAKNLPMRASRGRDRVFRMRLCWLFERNRSYFYTGEVNMQCCRWCGMESCDHAFVYRESLPTYARLRLLCERMTPARRYGWPFRWLLSLACLIFIGAALLPGSEVVFASTSAILRVSPTGFWAGGNCTGGGGGWTCMATVRETGSSQDSLNWSASSSLG